MAFLSRGWSSAEPAESSSPPKRISTPAGMRLSVIMENGGNIPVRSKRNSLFSSKASSNTLIDYPVRESGDDMRGGASGYSYSIFAEKPAPSSQGSSKISGFLNKKGGWKRLLILLALLLLSIVAIVVGLVVGLHKSSSSSGNSASTTSPGDSSSSGSQSANPSASGSVGATGTSIAPSSPTATSIPKDFPIGTYSFITFLGDVQTGCTNNPLTWTCFPYTLFSSSPTKALTTFNWIISAGSKSGSYQISSSTNPFAINFQNLPMTLVSKGNADERYTFQFQMGKEVLPSGVITTDGSTAKCFYNDTTFSGYLYTKMAKDYPNANLTVAEEGNPAYQSWPFAVRAEQVAASGADAPNCYEFTNGNLGARISGNFSVADPQLLCNCLYRNYQP